MSAIRFTVWVGNSFQSRSIQVHTFTNSRKLISGSKLVAKYRPWLPALMSMMSIVSMVSKWCFWASAQ
ncbi:MAG: hypothetical protein R2715_22075 [Ilumatobacteraceae bacterium]